MLQIQKPEKMFCWDKLLTLCYFFCKIPHSNVLPKMKADKKINKG